MGRLGREHSGKPGENAMKTWTLRLGLSLMVGIGCWANRLPAQEILVVPTVEYEPEHHDPYVFPFGPRPQPAPSKHLVCRALSKHGMACQEHPSPNSRGCRRH